MKFRLSGVLLLLITLFCFSCTSYKNVPYFQDLNVDSVRTERIGNYTPLLVQPGDLLAIHVNSLNNEQDLRINYNLDKQNGMSSISVDRPGENAVFGYLVDLDGNIKLPFLGNVKVSGYSTTQISTILEDQLAIYLSKPVVSVRLQNFKVSVMGDVKNPGTYSSNNERLTITEALSLAGDLNTTGIRQNILLIREENGNREYVKIDLRSKNTITSPYFYLKNNDVIYVQPNKEKVLGSDSTLQKFALVLSALSIVAIFITRVN